MWTLSGILLIILYYLRIVLKVLHKLLWFDFPIFCPSSRKKKRHISSLLKSPKINSQKLFKFLSVCAFKGIFTPYIYYDQRMIEQMKLWLILHIWACPSVHPDLAATMGSVWSFGEHCKNGSYMNQRDKIWTKTIVHTR